MKKPRRSKDGSESGAVRIAGRRNSRESSIVQLPMKENGDAKLETYERTVERPGPNSASADTPDGTLVSPDLATPD